MKKKLKLYTKEAKTTEGRKFKQYFTYVVTSEGKRIGVQVKFTMNAIEGKANLVAKGGFLTADVGMPKSLAVKEIEGKKVYPVIWVREIFECEPFEPRTKEEYTFDLTNEKETDKVVVSE